MPFADIDLARRIEGAEQHLFRSAATKVRQRLPGAWSMAIGGGFAAFTEPGSPLNKVLGLGFAPFDEVAWAVLETEHARRRAAIQVEISTLADPAIAKLLTARGYELVGVENVLGRALSPGTEPRVGGDVAIATCPATAIDTWLDVMVTGFGAPDTQGVVSHEAYDRAVLERIMRDFAAADGVELWLARRGGELAGAATLRRHDGIAQLCGASTLPAHRRHGVQSALLDYRIAHAARHGCELVVVTTQPGSKSQQNVQRQGFELLYSRNVLRREA